MQSQNSAPTMSFSNSDIAPISLSFTRTRSERTLVVAEKISKNVPNACCRQKCTKNIKTLLITFTLFSIITSAQVVGGIFANSLALLGDSASMAMDSVSYLVNIWAECNPNSKHGERNKLISSGISLAVLFAVTSSIVYNGLRTTMMYYNGGINGTLHVNPYIVFGFGVGGIIFDVISLCFFRQAQKRDGSSFVPEDTFFFSWELYSLQKDKSNDSLIPDDSGKVNMMSAMMHVLSDLLRSTTTVVLAFLLWFTNLHGVYIDAISALVVTALIIIGGLGVLREWVISVNDFCKGKKESREAFLKKPIDD